MRFMHDAVSNYTNTGTLHKNNNSRVFTICVHFFFQSRNIVMQKKHPVLNQSPSPPLARESEGTVAPL